MTKNFVLTAARNKEYKIRNKISERLFKDHTSEVRCIFFGASPRLSDLKDRYTVTLNRMVDPNELHKELNEIIPGADVSVLGPSSFPTDFAFITLPRTIPIHDFLAITDKVMEKLQR